MLAHADKKSAFQLGLTIFIYLAILTGLEYYVAISTASVLLLSLIALVKAGLVVYYYMHIYRLYQASEGDPDSYEYKAGTLRLGLWLFLLSDAFVFGGLAVARFNLLGLTRPGLNQGLGLIVTSVLLLSSFFMNRAETAIAHGDRRAFVTSLLVTLLLGAGFLVGVVGVEWPSAIHEGITPSANAAGAIFFMMTGMHAFHVLTGVLFLLIILRNGLRGLYSPERHRAVEAAAVYWHFVDVVWIFFYPALYLIGTVL
uniref:Cytochrome c oxidase subunit III n=1 Tax=uncultured Chloroflexota bacterium TaxID=166587 RepID=H5SDZ6_9CHLR|nr:cytochrome c oxidase subunit III [uncultured Chloroflexota bacterium]